MSLKVRFSILLLLTFLALIIISNISMLDIKVGQILAFTIIFFAFSAGYIFIWKILNPIEKYKIAIDRALKGEYVEVEHKTKDEIGELGKSLDKLINRLKRRDLENFIISRIDHILLSNIEIRDAVDEILRVFKEGLGYYRFSIYLVDKDDQKLRLLRSVGLEDKDLVFEISFGQMDLINYACMFRSSVYSPDVLNDGRCPIKHAGIRSEFDIPLLLGDEVIGVLRVESDKVDGIKHEDREFLSRIAPQLASAFRNAELYSQAIKRAKQLNVLNKVSKAIEFKTDIAEILMSVSKLIMETYKANKVAIFLKNQESKSGGLTRASSIGLSEKHIKAASSYTPWSSEENVFPIVIDDVKNDRSLFELRELLIEEGIKSLCFFPIVYKEKFIGRLDIYFNFKCSLEKEEIELGLSICNDVASAIENVRLFELLKNSEKFIKTVLENAPVGILRIDPEGRILYLNSEMNRVLGLVEADISKVVGKKLVEIFDIANIDINFFANEMTKGRAIKGHTISFRSLQGNEMSIVVDVQPVFTTDGAIDGYIVIVRDVTEEEKLQREKIELAKAIENLSEAVMITDANGNIKYVNPAFEKMTGYKAQEVIGKNPRILKSGKQDSKFYENMWKTILSGKIWEGELINRKKNGDFYYEYMSISPLFDANKRITNFIAIKRDITEQKLFEAQMLQFQKLESIGSISSGIAHDFNNILSAIQAGIKVLKRRLADDVPEIVKVLDILKKSADRGADITRRLLNFVRRESGKAVVVDVKDLIQEVKMLVDHSFPENIRVETFIDENVKFINADYGQMVQALMNLCINAKDAMPNGGVLRINVSSIKGEMLKGKFPNVSADEYVVISVSDTGVGIPEEFRERIFEAFFTTKPLGKGTGLGLPIVLMVVKAHNGYITYETEVGKGTTFYIYLPAVERKVGEVEEKVEIGKITPATILIVEDDKSLSYLLKEYLESRGYKVFATDNGYDAIEIYKANIDKIDLALIDIGLPTIDGISTFRKIKQINPNACVVLTSGYLLTEPSPATLMAEEGLNGFIQKPYDIDKIESLIERFIGRG